MDAKVFLVASLAASHVDDGSRGDDQQNGQDRGHEDQANPKERVGRERERHVRLGRDANRVGPAAQPACRVHDQVEVGRLDALNDVVGQRPAREQDEPGLALARR